MNRLSIILALILGLLVAAACGKEKLNNQKELDRVEPSSMKFSVATYSLEEGESRTLSISCEPDLSKTPVVSVQDESKQTAVEITSSNPSVVNVAGFTITALSAGTSTVTARLKKNPSVFCSCSVTVSEYIDAVTLTGITLSKSSLELSDLGSDGKGESEDITVTLQPSNAGWADVTVYSDDDRVSVEKGSISGGQGTLTLKVASNTAHNTTSPKQAGITVRAKKGGVSKTVSVKVCGHIYGISVPIIDQMKAQGDWRLDSDDKTILYVRGNSLSIVPEIAKTGDLRTGSASGTVSIVSENPSNIAIDSNGALSIPSSSVGGNSSTYYLKVTTTAAGISDIRIPVKTFEAPTGFTFKLNGSACSGGERVYVGNSSYRLSITPQPEKALCIVKLSGSYSELTDLTLNNLYTSTMVDFKAGSPARYSSSITVKTPVNSATATWNFYIDNYKVTDVKPGDFIYYNGSNYYFSDGGLRACKEGEWVRQDAATPKDASTLVGIVYDMTDNSSNTGLKLCGVLNYGTTDWGYYNGIPAHPAFISIKDPKAGTYTWEWCSSGGYTDIVADSNWPTSSSGANPKGLAAYLTYQVYQALRTWNTRVSSDKRVKAIYSVDNYNDYAGMSENQGISGSLPLKKATSSTYGSTGWMIPLANDIDNLAPFIGVVNTSISKAKSYSSSCADALTGPYWLANYSLTVVQDGLKKWVYAYAFVPTATGGNYVQEREKATNKLNVRPVAFL